VKTNTGCPKRKGPNFGRVFLRSNYIDITQNTYIQSWMVTEIMAREKCGLLAGPCAVPVSWQFYQCPSLSAASYYCESASQTEYLAQFFLEWEMFWDESRRENQNQHLMFNSFFFKSCSLWKHTEILYSRASHRWQYGVAIACWYLRLQTHPEYVAFPLKQWLHERA
jgi:hypothetical protein